MATTGETDDKISDIVNTKRCRAGKHQSKHIKLVVTPCELRCIILYNVYRDMILMYYFKKSLIFTMVVNPNCTVVPVMPLKLTNIIH